MRKIGFFLLFLINIAANLLIVVPCKADSFSAENNSYSDAQPQVSYSNNGTLEIIGEKPRPPSSKKPNNLEYDDNIVFPEASTDYKGDWYP